MPDDDLERGIRRLVDDDGARPEVINLHPRQWKSGRRKPRESILGPGASHLISELAMMAATLGLLIMVAVLAAQLNNRVHGLIFGERPVADFTWTPTGGLVPTKP